jgi:hydroxyacylglutathione hydrolase
VLDIVQIPALHDNYIYLLHDRETGAAAAVDPTIAEPVLEALEKRGWRLGYVFNTHHHGDHVGGNRELKRRTGCTIVGFRGDRARIPGIDHEVGEGDRVTLGASVAHVLETPGHTLGHIAYWFAEDDALFCGDTLFALGCGRLFEGTAEQMWASLDKFRALPPRTRVYCAHEYTQGNGRFALTVEPDNQALRARMVQVHEKRARGEPTVPSTLEEELATNPFLRADDPSLRTALGLPPEMETWRVFGMLRARKDRF